MCIYLKTVTMKKERNYFVLKVNQLWFFNVLFYRAFLISKISFFEPFLTNGEKITTAQTFRNFIVLTSLEKRKKISAFCLSRFKVTVVIWWKSSKLFLFDITSQRLCLFYLLVKRNHELIFVITGNFARWSSFLYFQELENKWLVASNSLKKNAEVFITSNNHLLVHSFIFSAFFENPNCHWN